MTDYRNSNFQSQQESHWNTNWDHPYNIGMSIGERIRDARKRAKLTQKQLAVKIGISQGALSELETGASEGTTYVASFASALGVNALWLETGKGLPTPGAGEGKRERTARMILAYDDEAALLDLFRRTDDRGRFEIVKLASREADRTGEL